MPDLQMRNLNCVCLVSALSAVTNEFPSEPNTINEALTSFNVSDWKESITETIAGHVKNKTLDIVDRSLNKNIVDCKWIYKIKRILVGY